ncbi:hypothetical protein JY651_50660 [Pyxidicoccus parkwayensis]|jgi:hypothetical protein|uniref:Lipoprotein n=1 Tax=Pyxidicoccus parkwayensis TaxID=2813578 RepID=A0ABX7P0Q2_9BACT|nr:hypothetical protein [Pyxidicoccus parkwaysis]QSQ23251.1 hypothetical protein JY651_50660 [Pyxidicoccus parkwaysis]
MKRSVWSTWVLVFTLSSVTQARAAENAPAPTKTQVNDAKAKEQLLGEHGVTLQWIEEGGKRGKAQVTEENGLMKLQAEQKDAKGNYVTVEGVIERVDAKSFVLVGKVETQVDYIAGGKACPREGRFTFRITGKRKYWRMKEMDNPCEDVVDYVDVYLR